MRLTGLLLLTLFGVGWLACEVPLAKTRPEPSTQIAWRRTRDGWERASWMAAEQPVSRPEIHPALVGITQLLFVLAVFVVCSEESPPLSGCFRRILAFPARIQGRITTISDRTRTETPERGAVPRCD